jgi:hypothetical protein
MRPGSWSILAALAVLFGGSLIFWWLPRQSERKPLDIVFTPMTDKR